MPRPSRRSELSFAVKAVLLCTALVSAFAASGSEPEGTHFSSDAAALYQRVSQTTAPAGADVLFLDVEETLVFDTEGRVVRSWYVLYKVLTQRGAEGWGVISAGWEPWHEERPSFPTSSDVMSQPTKSCSCACHRTRGGVAACQSFACCKCSHSHRHTSILDGIRTQGGTDPQGAAFCMGFIMGWAQTIENTATFEANADATWFSFPSGFQRSAGPHGRAFDECLASALRDEG